MKNGKEKLYLVRETKFVNNLQDSLRDTEKNKIACAHKHFDAIGADFKVSTDKALNDLLD